MTFRRAPARAAVAVIVCAALVVAGCGSNVPPGQFVGDGPFPGQGSATSSIGAQAVLLGPQANGAAGTTGTAGAAATGPALAPGQGTGGSGGGQGGGTGGSGGSSSIGNALTGITPGSCAGFHNSTGISDSTINVANASDLTGPIPGLFQSSEQAASAYAAYFDSMSSVCGRKLKVTALDTQTSDVGDQQAATTACSTSFAMVGSVSAYDSGGSRTVQGCGIPDLRAVTTNPDRYASPVTFGTDAIKPADVATEPWRFVKGATGNAYQKAAMIYLDNGAVVPNAHADQAAATSVGYNFVYSTSISIETFNYSPYVAKMQQDGVTFVEYVGAYQYAVRLKQAMDQQGFHPVFFMDSVAYDPAFVASVGSDGQGIWAFSDTALFEEASRNAEMQTYLTWLHRLYPSAQPSFFGLFAWGAMKLFAQLAVQLGGQLTRASLLQAIKAVHHYDANGLFAVQDVGGKQTPPCTVVIQLQGGAWQRRSPYPFACANVAKTGAA